MRREVAPHLREPHESAHSGEQRPDTTILVAQNVREGAGLERVRQAFYIIAQLSSERHVGNGIDVLEVVGHVDAPAPTHGGVAGPRMPRMTGSAVKRRRAASAAAWGTVNDGQAYYMLGQ
jgi:hypothetical protein